MAIVVRIIFSNIYFEYAGSALYYINRIYIGPGTLHFNLIFYIYTKYIKIDKKYYFVNKFSFYTFDHNLYDYKSFYSNLYYKF